MAESDVFCKTEDVSVYEHDCMLLWKCSVTALPGTYSDPDKVNAVLMHIEGPFYPCDQFGAFTQSPSLQCYRTPAEARLKTV